jgi:peptide/nickel transport system permease protein
VEILHPYRIFSPNFSKEAAMCAEAESTLPVSNRRLNWINASKTFSRVVRYTIVRAVTIFITVIIALFLTIIVANMGGYVDQIRRGLIREDVQQRFITDPSLRRLSAEEKQLRMNELVIAEEHRQGLDQPFMLRAVRYMWNAVRLDLGYAINMNSDSGSRNVTTMLLERLPNTLLLWTSSNILLFFLSIGAALFLSRRYGSFLDKMIVTLSPTSSAPAWFYGIFLILIFASLLKLLPFGGMVDTPPPSNPFEYAISLLKHMILPVLAFACSAGIASIYGWRTFFLIYSSEDYVEMAKAKGLSSRNIERRYIMRPTLPNIITNFALLLVFSWSGATVFETVFNWPGLGLMFYRAVVLVETSVIIGETVIYAYLLGITVFLLDFIYALVDPRVKIGGGRSA